MASTDADMDSELVEEIAVLQEIFIDELEIERDDREHISRIGLQIHPATGDQVEQKWVCLTLVFIPNDRYPEEVPQIHIKNPRGLSEDYVARLQHMLDDLAKEKRGECMLFELIQLAKDTLTLGNIPHGECVICCDGFCDDTSFTKTPCYHYFHCHCLLAYIEHNEGELEEEYQAALKATPHLNVKRKPVVCPVCRDPMPYDLTQLQQSLAPSDLDPRSVSLSPELRQLQQKMAALFQKQQEKGGIIDLEWEKNKYLVPSASSSSLNQFVETSSEVEMSVITGDEAVAPTPVTSDIKMNVRDDAGTDGPSTSDKYEPGQLLELKEEQKSTVISKPLSGSSMGSAANQERDDGHVMSDGKSVVPNESSQDNREEAESMPLEKERKSGSTKSENVKISGVQDQSRPKENRPGNRNSKSDNTRERRGGGQKYRGHRYHGNQDGYYGYDNAQYDYYRDKHYRYDDQEHYHADTNVKRGSVPRDEDDRRYDGESDRRRYGNRYSGNRRKGDGEHAPEDWDRNISKSETMKSEHSTTSGRETAEPKKKKVPTATLR